MKKLETFDSIYFWSKSHFEDDGKQNSLVFQPIERYFKKIPGVSKGRYVDYVYYWQSNGLSDEKINSIKTSNHVYLKQDKITFNHGKVVNIYIVHEISKSINISSSPTLMNCLFGAVRLTENADINKYKSPGYGIGFDRKGPYSNR